MTRVCSRLKSLMGAQTPPRRSAANSTRPKSAKQRKSHRIHLRPTEDDGFLPPPRRDEIATLTARQPLRDNYAAPVEYRGDTHVRQRTRYSSKRLQCRRAEFGACACPRAADCGTLRTTRHPHVHLQNYSKSPDRESSLSRSHPPGIF